MPAVTDSKDTEILKAQLLKPSSQLYFLAVVGCLIVLGLIAAIVILVSDLSLAFVAFVYSLCFGFIWMFAETLSEWIAKRAELSGKSPGLLYVPDVLREERRYGPLRAARLFGHPIGRRKN